MTREVRSTVNVMNVMHFYEYRFLSNLRFFAAVYFWFVIDVIMSYYKIYKVGWSGKRVGSSYAELSTECMYVYFRWRKIWSGNRVIPVRSSFPSVLEGQVAVASEN
jgi:hypothetical protein